MKNLVFLSLLLIFNRIDTFSQIDLNSISGLKDKPFTNSSVWQETYGGSGFEYATCIVNTFDGGFAVTGVTNSYGFGNYDVCLLKLDHTGTLQWVKVLGGAKEDIGNCIIQTSDSGYAIAGSTLSYVTSYYEDMYIIKLNSAGELLWARTIGRGGSDIASTIKEMSDGSLIAAGYTVINSPLEYGLTIVKLDNNGTVVWSRMAKKLGNGLLDPSVIQTMDGGYGIASSIDSVMGAGDICFLKLDNAGNLQWSWVIGGSNEEDSYSVCQTRDSGFAFAGFTNTFGAGYPDLYVVKVSKSARLEWTRTIGGDNDDYGFSILNNADGSFTVGGESFSYSLGSMDMYIINLDQRGNYKWGRTTGGPDLEFIRSIVPASDGGYVAVGSTYSFGAGERDMFIVKTDSAGNTCANTTMPVPHIDSGGTLLKYTVQMYNISPTIMSVGPNISGWGEISTLCLTEMNPFTGIIPLSFSLHQNYPNPFNPITKIQFDIPSKGQRLAFDTKLIIYDISGREITTLINEQLQPGSYSVDWDGTGYASGVYFYSLITNEFTETKRMVLVK